MSSACYVACSVCMIMITLQARWPAMMASSSVDMQPAQSHTHLQLLPLHPPLAHAAASCARLLLPAALRIAWPACESIQCQVRCHAISMPLGCGHGVR
jgi:hypothetical protein